MTPSPVTPEGAASASRMTPRSNLAVLWIIPTVYLLFVAAEFLAMTHLALDLTARGHSAFDVGLVASAMWIGIFLASLRAHRAVEMFGHPRAFVAGSFAATVAVAGMIWQPGYTGWLLAAGVLGLSGGFVWVAGESWLAEIAPRERRGFYVGLFETSVGLGMVSGPALLPLTHAIGLSPLGLALTLMAIGSLGSALLLRYRGPPAHPESFGLTTDGSAKPATSNWRAVAAPLAAVVVVSGLLEAGSSAMLPSIALRLGFNVSAAALLGAVIGAGSALLQAPAGLLADRIGLRRTMMVAWAVVVGATAVLLTWSDQPQEVLWAVGFLLGGVGGSVYTLVVIELGHRLSGSGLVRSMSLLVTAYTAGTAAGPALGGWLFDAVGLRGLAAALLLSSVAGSAVAWRATREKPASRV